MATTSQSSSLLRVVVAGDVMLGRLVDQCFKTHVYAPEDASHAVFFLKRLGLESIDHEYVWGDLLPLFRGADLRLINLETSVTTSEEKWPDKAFNYRMHPDNLQALKAANIDYCSLANNHTLDFSVTGLNDTMRSLTNVGIKWAGVGMNLDEAMKPALVEFQGKKMACFSIADHFDMWEAKSNSPGINYFEVLNFKTNPGNYAKLKAAVTECRKTHAPDLLTISIHWGSNYAWHPPNQFREFAHQLIDDLGVDLIHGHSSHHVQGIEIYKEKVILYGCGDFIDDYAVDEDYRNDLGFCYVLHLDPQTCKWKRIELVPTKIRMFQVVKNNHPRDREWCVRVMKTLCKKLGTVVEGDDKSDSLTINVIPDGASQGNETRMSPTHVLQK